MMNQLVSVDDKLNGKVYNYTYDAGGNLISETVTDSNGTTSNAYEYNNSNWGDVLTSYNGQNIPTMKSATRLHIETDCQ